MLRSDSIHSLARVRHNDGAPGSTAPAHGSGWAASLALGFERRGPATILTRRQHRGPLRVQKPLYEEGEGVCQAIIVHPPGGVVGGDRLDSTIEVAAGAHALITTPGATKWYRSAGATARQTITLRLQTGARLEWMPQETILYAGAMADSRFAVELAPGACYLGWDVLCLGRAASGERFDAGCFSQRVAVHAGPRPLFLECARIAGGSTLLASPAGLAGHVVSGLMLIAAEHLDKHLVDALRAVPVVAPDMAGITRLASAQAGFPDVIAVRHLGASAQAARRHFAAVRSIVRPVVFGRSATAPRIWNC